MSEIVHTQVRGGALTEHESNALKALAMMPLQQVGTKVTLSLPFERLATLLRSIKYNLAKGQDNASTTPIVHFISPHKGPGADVIAFELAYVAATQSGKRVLFVNTNGNSSLVADKIEANALAPAHTPAEGASFFFTTISSPDSNDTLLPDAQDFKRILDDLRTMFDLIVIHSDSALTAQMAITLYGLTDGAVLVVEAEHTRVPVIRQLRNAVEAQGGRVVGVVLNKRKYYIPRKIYSFLFRTAD